MSLYKMPLFLKLLPGWKWDFTGLTAHTKLIVYLLLPRLKPPLSSFQLDLGPCWHPLRVGKGLGIGLPHWQGTTEASLPSGTQEAKEPGQGQESECDWEGHQAPWSPGLCTLLTHLLSPKWPTMTVGAGRVIETTNTDSGWIRAITSLSWTPCCLGSPFIGHTQP